METKQTDLAKSNNQMDEISQELKSRLHFEEGWVDRFSKFTTGLIGSVGFLIFMVLVFLLWIAANIALIPGIEPFDPYPFGILTLIAALLAILLSIFVLISQNRQGKIADIRQQIEFEVNVLAESEITKMLVLLDEIHTKLGINSHTDIELEEMKEAINVQALHEIVEKS